MFLFGLTEQGTKPPNYLREFFVMLFCQIHKIFLESPPHLSKPHSRRRMNRFNVFNSLQSLEFAKQLRLKAQRLLGLNRAHLFYQIGRARCNFVGQRFPILRGQVLNDIGYEQSSRLMPFLASTLLRNFPDLPIKGLPTLSSSSPGF